MGLSARNFSVTNLQRGVFRQFCGAKNGKKIEEAKDFQCQSRCKMIKAVSGAVVFEKNDVILSVQKRSCSSMDRTMLS